MNILITGAGGFLGNELIKQLIATEHQAFALTSNKKSLQKKFPNNCEVFSIEEWKNETLPLQKIDTVIHCAFSRTFDFISLKESLDFSKDIFSKADYNIINISSRSVYGQNPQIPWLEDSEVQPDTMYAFSKYATELLINLKDSSNNTSNYTNIRLAGLIGVEFNDRLINKFIDFAIVNNAINIKGGGQQFAYLDTRDAASAIISLLETDPKKWNLTYNLGHTESFNIIEIANTVKKVATEFIQKEVIINIDKTDAVLYANIDSSRFYQDTHWKPQYSLEEMIRRIFKYKLKQK